MKKVLIITYYWPPSGGAGVQRWLKFSKYLPEFGWEPVILTVDPEFAAYPVTDNSLTEEISAGLSVYKTKATDYFSIYKKDKTRIPSAGFANSPDNTFKGKFLRFVRGNFFLPDPRKGWNKFALKKACDLINSEAIKHVITTSPPHSTQLIGLKLKEKYPDVKWIADLRDPWTDIYYYKHFYPTPISKSIDEGYEKSVIKNADRIITVGNSLKKIFTLKEESCTGKTEVITNGYDEGDFNLLQSVYTLRLTITYVGTLSDIYPVDGLLVSLKNLQLEGKEFTLRFVGTVSPVAREHILSSVDGASVEFVPYVAHSEAIKYMNNSTVLLLIIPLNQNNKSIITGKLFEYIAAQKPVLCIGPVDGDAAEIIKECRSGITADYNDHLKMSEFLTGIDNYSVLPDKRAILEFSRFNLTKRIAGILENEEI